MVTVGGTALADVYCNIEDGTFDTTDQLRLGIGGTLEVQSSHHSVTGFALVVLDKAKRGLRAEGRRLK